MLAFVAAEAREFDGVLRNAERVSRPDWPLQFARMAWLKGREVVLAANGPGPKLAGEAADIVREHQELEGLASIGFCGALNPALQACDIFVATHILREGRECVVAQSLADSRGPARTGKLLSIDRVLSTAEEKAELRRQTGADAVEMEAAAVAERAARWKIPFYAIRVVTDTAGESFPLDFNRLRDREGRFSRARIVAAALRRPAASFPALLNLNRRCNSAARALGDFIADTRL